MKVSKAEHLANKPEPEKSVRDPWEPGMVSQVAKMLRVESPSWHLNRRQWRKEAKSFMKDPIQYEKYRLDRIHEEREAAAKQNTLISVLQSIFKKEKKHD